jgi:hypothetical protein
MKGFALEQGTAARANRITPGAGKLHRDFVGAEKVVQAVQVARAETSGADARHAFPVRRYAHTRHLFGIRACAEEGGARGIRSEIGRSAVASSRDRAAPDAAKPLVADRPVPNAEITCRRALLEFGKRGLGSIDVIGYQRIVEDSEKDWVRIAPAFTALPAVVG